MGKLTTHVLDTARGKPAAGVKIWLYRVTGNSHKKIAEVVTNDDGRVDGPILEGKAFTEGGYELVFHAGDYLRASGQAGDGVLFLDEIPIRFGIADADAVLMVVPAQATRTTLAAIGPRALSGKPVILCAKGLESGSVKACDTFAARSL